MPLKRVPKESTLLFVKGSHRWRKQFIPRKFATQLNYEVRSMSGFEDEKYGLLFFIIIIIYCICSTIIIYIIHFGFIVSI